MNMNIQAVRAKRLVKRKLLVQMRVKVAKHEALFKCYNEDLEHLENEVNTLDSIIKNFTKSK